MFSAALLIVVATFEIIRGNTWLPGLIEYPSRRLTLFHPLLLAIVGAIGLRQSQTSRKQQSTQGNANITSEPSSNHADVA